MQYLEDLPVDLKSALVRAGLADPCVLEDYPRMSAEEIHERGVVSQGPHKLVMGILTSGMASGGSTAAMTSTSIGIGGAPPPPLPISLPVSGVSLVPASLPTESTVSTSVPSDGFSGETNLKTVRRKARLEKSTVLKKGVKGTLIAQKARTGGNTMPQSHGKAGFEARTREDKTGRESPSFQAEISNLKTSDFDVTSSQFSQTGPDMAASSGVSSSEGLDPTLPSRSTGGPVPSPPDILLLYWTLVADGTVPSGYEREFIQLEPAIKQASERTNKRYSREDNLSAAVWLHRRQEMEAKRAKTTKQAVDQFVLATLDRAARFKCKWQSQFFEGPAARRDAEESLRKKWLDVLEGLLKGTKKRRSVNDLLSASREPCHWVQVEEPPRSDRGSGWSKGTSPG